MEEAKEDEARRGGAGGRGGAAGDRRLRMGPRVTGCTETVEASVFANEPSDFIRKFSFPDKC